MRNEGKQPFTAKYAGQKYQINPAQDAIVPWDAMCLWFGRPQSIDIDKKRRYRTQEFQRLCVRYGVYENHHLIPDRFPQIAVHDVFSGDKIITVVDDPEGKHLSVETATLSDTDLLRRQIETMQSQMLAMQRRLENGQQIEASDMASDARTDQPDIRPERAVAVVGPLQYDDDVETDTPQTPRPVAKRQQ